MAKKQQALPQRKIPMRQCLGCNEHKPKIELIRILRTPDGEITLDTTGKKSGRGAYICKSISCLNKAKKASRIERSLECSIPEDIYAKLEEELKA